MSSSQYQGRVSRVLAVASYAAVLFVFAPHWAHAQAVQSLDQQEQRDRAQREAQARQQQQAQPDVRLDSGHATDFRRTDVQWDYVKVFFVVLCALLGSATLVGCATDELYSPNMQQASPERWPDPIRVCTRRSTVVSQLRLEITTVYIPETSVKTCDPRESAVSFRDNGNLSVGGGKVDPSGRGEYALSYYRAEIDDPQERRQGEGLVAEEIQPTFMAKRGLSSSGAGIASWRHHEQIYSRNERINDRDWRHYAFTTYDSPSPDPSIAGNFRTWKSVGIAEQVNNAAAISSITELYVHVLDQDHAIIAFGRYGRPVIEDSEWYASRSHVLETMIEHLEIRDLTEDDVSKVRAAYNARNTERMGSQ